MSLKNSKISIPDMEAVSPLYENPTQIRFQRYLADSYHPDMPLFLPQVDEDILLTLKHKNINKKFDVQNWVVEYFPELLKQLKQYPVILLRNLKINSIENFNLFCKSTNLSLLSYESGNAPRKQVKSNAFTASHDPPDFAIVPHNEMSYALNYPDIVIFYCHSKPSTGGETPIGCVHKLTDLIDPFIREKFERLGIKYARYLPHKDKGLLFNWQSTFYSNEVSKVNQLLEDLCYEFNWDNEGGLSYSYNQSAFITHPITGKKIWFNQVTSDASWTKSHPDYVDLNLPYEKAPNHCYYGNGEEIEKDVLGHIRSSIWKASFGFTWFQGDILIIDNLSATHARLPYTGTRKILASLGKLNLD